VNDRLKGISFIPENKVDLMFSNGLVLDKILHEAKDLVLKGYEDGITELDVDSFVTKRIKEENCFPSCKGYHGYSHSVCISVNDVLVHGVPTNRKFEKGDLVTIDCAINRGGYHVDKALPFIIGEESNHNTYAVMMASLSALDASIAEALPGNTVGDIGYKTLEIASSFGFFITEKFVGHGVGRELHMLPSVPNYGIRKEGQKLIPGMCIAIEPMILQGSSDVYITDDGWTVKSFNELPCCHCEDTVYISDKGPMIITRG
jgi:methionyl aminopeptidase